LRELLSLELEFRAECGEEPDVAALRARFPEYLEVVEAVYAFSALSGNQRTLGAEPREQPRARRRMAFASHKPHPRMLEALRESGYVIDGELGRGGMGVVYLARKVALNRPCALKMILAGPHAGPMATARFLAEAEAVARLHHPDIVQIYHLGEVDGLPFIELEYLPGGSLDKTLDGTPRPAEETARLLEVLALAIAEAHRQGVVHRDLKPANVLLDADGRPKVGDFGLAKMQDSGDALTRTKSLLGSPCYMAPEQAEGLSRDVGPTTDVYALGVILYELLTGRPPFLATTVLETLAQIKSADPVLPSRFHTGLPRDLETICLRCLEKEPRARYPDALKLAEDLHRFLEHRPILARRIHPVQWVWRWFRREPVKGGLVAALIGVFLAGFLGVAAQWRRAEQKAQAEIRARTRAENAEERSRNHLYIGEIVQARLEWRLNNLPNAESLLDRCDTTRRGWEWHYLHALNHPGLINQAVDEVPIVSSVAFSPDGKRYAFTGYDPYTDLTGQRPSPIEVWDAVTGKRIRKFQGPGSVLRLSFSPDGRHLAASGSYGVEVWDLVTGRTLYSWKEWGSATYSPDGRSLVCSDREGVTFRDPATGQIHRRMATGWGRVDLRLDGQVLAVSGPDAVELREVATGREIRRLPHGPSEGEARAIRFHAEEGPNLAFSPDGRFLVVATSPPRIWDTATGQVLHQLASHSGPVSGVAFNPDGRTVATAGNDSTIRIWDVQTGAERSVLRGHLAWVGSLAFDAEGRRLLSGGRHVGQVILWDLTSPLEYRSLSKISALAFAFRPNGRQLSLVDLWGRLQTRDTASGATAYGPRLDLTQQWLTPAVLAEYSADGRRVATIANDRLLVKVWDQETGRQVASLSGLDHQAMYLAVSRDGGRVAVSGLKGRSENRTRQVMVWDVKSGDAIYAHRPFPAQVPYLHGCVAMSADGGRVAFDDYSSVARPGEPGRSLTRIRVCELPSGRELLSLPFGDSPIQCIAFSNDGLMLVAASQSGTLTIWEAATGRILHHNKVSAIPFKLAFSPDDQRLAIVDREMVSTWDTRSGQQVLILRGAPQRPFDGGFNPTLAWSPDGRFLASSNWDASVSVWDGGYEGPSLAERNHVAETRRFLWHLTEAESAAKQRQFAAVEFHLAQVRGLTPLDDLTRLQRARLELCFDHESLALADYEPWAASRAPYDGLAWLNLARLYCLRNDRDGYRRVCAQMLEDLDRDPFSLTTWYVAQALGLAPLASTDVATLVQLAERAYNKPRPEAFSGYTLGLAYYRAGNWAAAETKLREALERKVTVEWLYWPLLALVHERMGHREDARRWLRLATEERERQNLSWTGETPPSRGPSEEWLDFRILLNEATATIASK